MGPMADGALEEQVGATATALCGETEASSVEMKYATSPQKSRVFITGDVTNGACYHPIVLVVLWEQICQTDVFHWAYIGFLMKEPQTEMDFHLHSYKCR